jgi:hypothetical protein
MSDESPGNLSTMMTTAPVRSEGRREWTLWVVALSGALHATVVAVARSLGG